MIQVVLNVIAQARGYPCVACAAEIVPRERRDRQERPARITVPSRAML